MQILNDAATVYKVDTDAIAAKVKQEFAAKNKARKKGRRNHQPSKRQRPRRNPLPNPQFEEHLCGACKMGSAQVFACPP